MTTIMELLYNIIIHAVHVTNGSEELTENDETKLTFEVVFIAKGISGT